MRGYIINKQCAVCDERSILNRTAFCICCIICCLLNLAAFAQKANKAIHQGNEAYRKADFTTAIKDYTKALDADDKNAVARFNMANAFQHNSDAVKAVQAYDEVIKNNSDADLQSKAFYNMGLSQLQQKNIAEAIDAFKQSLRLTPNDNDARENLQKALEEMKRQQQSQPQQQNQKQQPPPKKQQQQQRMNQQMMEQKFKELQEQEKQLQKELQKQKSNQPDQEKDW